MPRSSLVAPSPDFPPDRVLNRIVFMMQALDSRKDYPLIKMYPYLRRFVAETMPDIKRFAPGEFEAALVTLFGPMTGRWLHANMRQSVSVARMKSVLENATDNSEPVAIDGSEQEVTVAANYVDDTEEEASDRRVLREYDLDRQREARASFAEFLEDREGVVNPRRMYRQWLRGYDEFIRERKPRYGEPDTKYVHIKKDIYSRIGMKAAQYVMMSKAVSRRHLAKLMRAL